MRVEKCPECGSRYLGKGKFSSNANIYASTFRSSPVEAIVCSNCGLIIEQRVTKPELFVPKER